MCLSSGTGAVTPGRKLCGGPDVARAWRIRGKAYHVEAEKEQLPRLIL
jgi:hypothetical protein